MNDGTTVENKINNLSFSASQISAGDLANNVQTALNNLDSGLANHTHNYLPLSGGTATGSIQSNGDVIAGLGTSNQVSLQTLNSNLAKLHNSYFHSLIINSTVTNGNVTTYGGRKISDYDILVFTSGNGTNDVRNTVLIPTGYFINGMTALMNTLHGSLGSSVSEFSVSGVTIKYINDTTVYIILGGSKALNCTSVYGIKF